MSKNDNKTPIKTFMTHHYRHFNAAVVVEAAEAYCRHIHAGGTMFVTLAGAMSTAELGIHLAKLIRRGLIGGISCTGANLEEDVYNLVAHTHYERIANWRELTPRDEKRLLDKHLNRVTDTCIPEEEAIRRIEGALLSEWQAADRAGERRFPHEFFFRALRSGALKKHYDTDPAHSWMLAAAETDLFMVVPGWEDSTNGNIFSAHCIEGDVRDVRTMRSGIEYMMKLAEWYTQTTKKQSIGFFQVGGGIAGDFPICVVPMLHQDLRRRSVPLWGYFCQIGDSTTSYGSYSGATPNEKITWGKVSVNTPRYMIESDATIVAPLIFEYVLESFPEKRGGKRRRLGTKSKATQRVSVSRTQMA
ncbi:MAG: deoxyhypusine synthase family protein [Planctomycetota bacterium]|nr:deoxyhypusine synthase family protein [Planctomycetota bacterium]